MSDVVIVQNGGTLEHRLLHDLLPREVRHGVLALDALVPGFRMAHYESPPGDFPSVQFTRHMVGVGADSTAPCSLFWRGQGGMRSRVMYPDTIFTLSQGPVEALHWDGWLKMLTLSVEPAAMEAVLPEPAARRAVELLPIRAGAADRVLSHLLGAIRHEADGGYPNGRIFIESLCHTTALYLATRYGVWPAKTPRRQSGLARDVLRRVLEYIDACLADDLSVATLASVACLSPYHFGKMFQRTTGLTVHRYVTQRRLARARELLTCSEMRLSEIAVAAGFYDQSQMTYVFRRHMGTTPRAYRGGR